MTDNSLIHDWLVTGGSSKEGCRFLLERISSTPLKQILDPKRKVKAHVQIIREALAHRIGFRAGRTFREEFPFLRAPDCPAEMKILAADKITAYQNYRDAHRALFSCNNAREQFLTAKLLVENYLDNQLIYRELDYYKQHKKILGKHPVFTELNRIKFLRKLTPIELVERKSKLEHNIWRIESEIAKGDKPHLQVEREKKLQIRKNELSEIIRLIESYR